MNVYDFDKTIYDGDSTIDFFLFSLKKDLRLLRFLPRQCFGFVLYTLKKISKTEFKARFFSFLNGIHKKEEHLQEFWMSHEKKIKEWYLEQQQPDDVIISASPEFLLAPICKQLHISHLIASEVDPQSGKFAGNNCYGAEKVLRFRERFPDGTVDAFYSDSTSDLPMAEMAKSAFIVKKDRLIPWAEYKPSSIEKLKKLFLDIKFIKFFLVGIVNAINGVVFASLFSLFIQQANVAFALGYCIALTISYLLNTFFVFSEKGLSFHKFLKFCISYLPNFIIQNILVSLICHFFPIPKLFVYTISVAIAFPLTYLLLACFTFGKKKQS